MSQNGPRKVDQEQPKSFPRSHIGLGCHAVFEVSFQLPAVFDPPVLLGTGGRVTSEQCGECHGTDHVEGRDRARTAPPASLRRAPPTQRPSSAREGVVASDNATRGETRNRRGGTDVRSTRLLVSIVAAVTTLGVWAPAAAASHNADEHSPNAVRFENIPRSSEFRWGDPRWARASNPIWRSPATTRS